MTHQDEPAFAVGTDNWNQLGLTKREYFAALALQGLAAAWLNENVTGWTEVSISEQAVKFADLTIAALNKNQNSGS